MGGLALVETTGLAVGYGQRVVASGIDLRVGPGEVLCLLGPNGAGKTTLFKTLLGLLPALGGEIRLGGRPIASLTRSEAARAIAYVPQTYAAEFAYSVLDLVLMGRTAHLGVFASPGAEDHRRAWAALESLGIADLADADSTRISGGQRQLALIARALAQDAQVVVMDEPTASLDFGNRLLVLDHIHRLVSGGLAVILSTHEPDQAFAVATSVAITAKGAVIAVGTPDAVVTGEVLSRAYGVPIAIEQTTTGRKVVAPAR